jgi:hypothetical protein
VTHRDTLMTQFEVGTSPACAAFLCGFSRIGDEGDTLYKLIYKTEEKIRILGYIRVFVCHLRHPMRGFRHTYAEKCGDTLDAGVSPGSSPIEEVV